MTVPTGRESDKFMLRLPDGMRDRIKVAAEKKIGRSMNAEIVSVLTEHFPEELVNRLDNGPRTPIIPVDTELEEALLRWLRMRGHL